VDSYRLVSYRPTSNLFTGEYGNGRGDKTNKNGTRFQYTFNTDRRVLYPQGLIKDSRSDHAVILADWPSF
jgi:hypothetical protein